MTTLISFLGKERRDPNTGYQRATYRFDDGREVQTPFFGSALIQQLRPSRVLLLGTAGSMWDALDLDIEAPEWAELVDASERGDVNQALLDRVSLRARATMPGAELVLMPFARNEAEQLDLLANLAGRVGEGEQVVIDITHGFRHLPLLALVAARYLTHVRRAVVSGIYYGALQMTPKETGITPVLKLDGLLRMLDWVEAFAAHDASGNYGVFAPLLKRDGLDAKAAEMLERAAHQERVTNASDAAQTLSPLLGAIGQLPGPTQLFAGQLHGRLEWSKKPAREDRELALFEAYLERGDFLRATIFLQESNISRLCSAQNLNPLAHDSRNRAKESLLGSSAAFKELSAIRNNLAHGTDDGDGQRAKNAKAATESAAVFKAKLKALSKDLRREQ